MVELCCTKEIGLELLPYTVLVVVVIMLTYAPEFHLGPGKHREVGRPYLKRMRTWTAKHFTFPAAKERRVAIIRSGPHKTGGGKHSSADESSPVSSGHARMLVFH